MAGAAQHGAPLGVREVRQGTDLGLCRPRPRGGWAHNRSLTIAKKSVRRLRRLDAVADTGKGKAPRRGSTLAATVLRTMQEEAERLLLER